MNKRIGLFLFAAVGITACSTSGNSTTDNNPLAGVTIQTATPTPAPTATPVPTATPTPAPMSTQAIADSGFETEGMAGEAFTSWSKCSFPHTSSAGGSATPIPAVSPASITADIVSAAGPSFDVGPTPAAPASSPTPYAVVTTSPNSGTYAALAYAGTEANRAIFPPNTAPMASVKAGISAVCQSFVVPTNGSLTLYVNEGANDTNNPPTIYFDQEADLFAGDVSAIASATPVNLFQDADSQNPNGGPYVSGYQKKGPYNLTGAPYNFTPGQTVTLAVGAFESSASAFYGSYILVDDVTVTGTTASAASKTRKLR